MQDLMNDTTKTVEVLKNKIDDSILIKDNKSKNSKSDIANYILSNGKTLPKDFKEALNNSKQKIGI